MNETSRTAMSASETQKQSKVGIAAAIITVIGMACFCLYVVWFASSSTLGPLPIKTTNLLFDVFNFTEVMAMIMAVIGGVVGIVSLFQKNQKKTFGIVALMLTALILCGSCGFYAWAFLTPK